MSGTTLVSLALALAAVAVAYGAVLCAQPAARRFQGWSTRGRLPLWLTSPASRGLLVLAAGMAAAFTLTAIFLQILDEVHDDDDLTAVDRPTVAWIAHRRTDTVETVVLRVTDIGGQALLVAVLAVAASAVALRLRSWRPVVLAVVASTGGTLLVSGIKNLIGRDRPDPMYQVVAQTGHSFPSGHTTSALVVLGTVAWLASMATANWTLRATAWVTAGVLAVAVGLSRVYLGVHYPSDVLAGWVLGACWLVTVALAARLPTTALPLLASGPSVRKWVADTGLRPLATFTVTALGGLTLIFGAVSVATFT
ncbi:phosphatase PAP2 family protein [Frankia sp. CNm7]|uniref:Phosphatase PAP2 family protein n=1 Tax=Frankia nepalensis TaxID=1836974 RepID=A0A937RIG7_9ACTN|nr:phosphatase PAP2 family protein [Frankia nepalensis]MBL7498931.1 phosphatase PAP2 family protein [Frankia nepalensis]MBL7511272.1 phosphatase PAP2 family protein [Frankia nepalensis]MBL7520554.1 phosphatase PAP2 family protein [Frankia nepalensis]MBL7630792.1 phosphatase PAP2 family protein [Frankia nepalensis]